MRKLFVIAALLAVVFLIGSVRAETFTLTDGKELTGELLPSSATDIGVKIKTGENEYETVSWASFSQDTLKKLMANKKLEAFVEPFIEVPREEHRKKTEVEVKVPPPLDDRTKPAHSLFGAMFSSGLGLMILLLLYAGNLYAAYEVAIFRAQSPALVCGVSAAAPIVGPIIFLSIPTKVPPPETWQPEPQAAPAAAAAEAVNPMQAAGAEHPTGLHLAAAAPEPAKPAHPETVRFQRGQFTFNRRFFETKFPGFFGVVRRDAERDMVLLMKTSRGQYVGQRIARIAANDLHLEVHEGTASHEVLIPFSEIQEIQLKHKDA
ncbi:MAG: hypothetical protein C5B50_26225 [Verrucomicrobia bacterium]|nr:MAG: hypothetical protein C5B50_26225 [Verrucomicrobiota bacterium]